MIPRYLMNSLQKEIARTPAVVLLGARQVGKTTLAKIIAQKQPSIYLDLESPEDLSRFADPLLFFREHRHKLIILDELQRTPDLFMTLRGVIDEQRFEGHHSGQFLLLGSAALSLLRQTSQSLAGRVSYIDMHGLNLLEIHDDHSIPLWVRGGFPNNYLAPNDDIAMTQLEHLIRSYLERDIPELGLSIPSTRLRRLWTMLAHLHGTSINQSHLAGNLEVDRKTINHYVDILTELYLVRRLPPWHKNDKKRLIKSPRYYIRDSGILHRLLGIGQHHHLLSHPVLGKSWEGFVIENIHSILSPLADTYYYRTTAGAEIDLVITLSHNDIWAIEIKYGLSPKIGKYFQRICDDIGATHRFIVYSGDDEFPVREDVRVISVKRLMNALINAQTPQS